MHPTIWIWKQCPAQNGPAFIERWNVLVDLLRQENAISRFWVCSIYSICIMFFTILFRYFGEKVRTIVIAIKRTICLCLRSIFDVLIWQFSDFVTPKGKKKLGLFCFAFSDPLCVCVCVCRLGIIHTVVLFTLNGQTKNSTLVNNFTVVLSKYYIIATHRTWWYKIRNNLPQCILGISFFLDHIFHRYSPECVILVPVWRPI